MPAFGGFLPVKRHRPSLGLAGVPAVGKPEFRTVVTGVGDESEVFARCDEAAGKLERAKIDLVAGKFIIEGETCASNPISLKPPGKKHQEESVETVGGGSGC